MCMSSVSNNSSSSASSASSRNRYAGLISGLDTEAMVKAMSANTKTRLNSKKQKLQTLMWKQESYQSIISKISDFKDKYLNILSDKSIKANAVMKKCTAVSSDDKVITATAAPGATGAKYTISEASKATTAAISTTGEAAEGSIKLDFSRTQAGKSYSVNVTLDGTSKTIVFKGGAGAEASKTNFLDAANSAFSGIKGASQSFEFKDGSTLVFNGDSDGVYHTFGVSAGEEAVGLKTEKTSKITTSSTLGSIGFTQKLSSDNGSYNININGKTFEFTNDTTVSEMINAINTSGAGVKMSFSNVSQSFKLETNDTGAGQEISVYQTNGNLLNSLFNIGTDKLGTSSADSAVIEYQINDSYTEKLSSVITDKLTRGFDIGDTSKYKLNLTIDGTSVDLEVDLSALTKKADGDDDYTDAEISKAISDAVKKSYNDKTGETLYDDKISISYAEKSLTFQSDDYKIEIGANDLTLTAGSDNVKTVKGDRWFLIAEGVNDMKFTVNGEEKTLSVTGTSGIRIGDLVDSGLFTLRSDGTLVANSEITAADDASRAMFNKYFGKETLSPATANDTLTAHGSNSKLVLSSDGEKFVTYTSATNVFSFDGTTINVSNTGSFKADTEEDYITVTTSKDTSGIKDVVKGFVEDYNKLLDDLYGEVKTSRPKKSGSYYDPLTEEQEEEMSEDEIKKWNEQAKVGLLYRDSSVQRFLSELRGAMSTVVDGFKLSDMGVNLTDSWEDNGKLEIDESKLESAINAYGDKIADFFTSSNGLAAKLENVTERAISTKTKKYGYLTSLAGMKNTKTDKDNQIYKQIESLQKIIDNINKKYEAEQERYWSKFTALETYMAKMQQQSSYFMSE